jgi:hypothetical protein
MATYEAQLSSSMADKERLSEFDQAIARDSESIDAEARLRVAQAVVGKGDTLLGLGPNSWSEGCAADVTRSLRVCAALVPW